MRSLYTAFHSACYVPTNSTQKFPFLHILAKTSFFLITAFLTGVGCWPLQLWLAFPRWLVRLSTFSCALWPSVCLLWKNVYSDPLSHFKSRLFVVFLVAELYELFTYLGYQTLVRFMTGKYVPPFSRLPFHFVDSFLLL